MHGSRFDALARSLRPDYSRRGLLRVLGGLALGSLGLADLEEVRAKSGACKPKCGECEQCDKGKCHKNNNGKTVCKKGKCKAKAPGTPCSIGTCQNGSCVAPQAAPCVPEPQATTCAGRCGLGVNNCGQGVSCTCPTDFTCLTNQSCARRCESTACPTACAGCSVETRDGQRVCLSENVCEGRQPCNFTSECPVGFVCLECPASTLRGCHPLCQA